MSSAITDKDLIAFRAISSFVDELSSIFEKKQHPLKLYKRLITKTTLNHETAIVKHIETFKAFCIENREPIKNRNISKLEGKIEYSARVFIDLKTIMSDQENDTETIDAIWNHMLAISAIVDPENKTKEILKKRMKKSGNNNHQRSTKSSSSNNEASSSGAGNAFGLISSLMGSLQSEIGQSGALNESEGDPLKLITNIMSSGVFTKLLGQVSSGLKDQNVDISELMGATQSMFSNMQQGGAGNGQAPDIQNILSSVMSNLAQASNSSAHDNEEQQVTTGKDEPDCKEETVQSTTFCEQIEQPSLSVVEPVDQSIEFHQPD